MWGEALAMIERAEQLHRRFFEPGFSAVETSCWEPPVDIFDNDQELWIVAALPGVDVGDLSVSAEGDILLIEGVRRLPIAARGSAIQRLEIPHGRFERRIRLPAHRLTLHRSQLVNGCLIVRFAKHD